MSLYLGMGRRAGRQARMYEWMLKLPKGEEIYISARYGGHTVSIDLNGEGFLASCSKCGWESERIQRLPDVALALADHVESRN